LVKERRPTTRSFRKEWRELSLKLREEQSVIADCQLPIEIIADCQLPIANCQLPIAD
jgi:hypothetical protein